MEFLKKATVLLLSLLLINALNAQDLKTVFKKSYELEKNGKYIEAIEKIKTVYDENSYEINLRLGWLAYSAGSFTESISYYNKAIELMPLSIEAQLGLVYPASAVGNWNQVINAYNKILMIDKQNATANYKLGYIYYYRKDYEKAYRYFQRLLNNYPFEYNYLIMFAWTNLKLGKTREAKVLFNKVLLLSPDDSSAKEGLKNIK